MPDLRFDGRVEQTMTNVLLEKNDPRIELLNKLHKHLKNKVNRVWIKKAIKRDYFIPVQYSSYIIIHERKLIKGRIPKLCNPLIGFELRGPYKRLYYSLPSFGHKEPTVNDIRKIMRWFGLTP